MHLVATSTHGVVLQGIEPARANIDASPGVENTWGGAGWVEVDYGASGNVSSFTVHGACVDAIEPASCTDLPSGSLATRIANFRANCRCATEQHTSLRWDELNRLVEGRRYDRVGGPVGSGTGAWQYRARMRYRYDGSNQRTVKETFEAISPNASGRVALTVYPGDFERRGLVRNGANGTYDAVTTGSDATETQYLVLGTRVVWDASTPITGWDRDHRLTYAFTDLLQTSAGVMDLRSLAILELSTYTPNGARENLYVAPSPAPLEPMGFTGKESDEELGMTYFGERWLIPRLGRWASPDPLHVHASGGGEALNSYHYVSGNLLQARDPLGLYKRGVTDRQPSDTVSPRDIPQTHAAVRERAAQHAAAQHLTTLPQDAAAAVVNAVEHPVDTIASVLTAPLALAARVGRFMASVPTGPIDLDRLDGDPVELGAREGAGRPLAIVTTGAAIGLSGPGLALPRAPVGGAVAEAAGAEAVAGEAVATTEVASAAEAGPPAGASPIVEPGPQAPPATIRVGRWMSARELRAMERTGTVQMGAGDTTYVVTDRNPDTIGVQPGADVFVEFDVPQGSVNAGYDATNPAYGRIGGPNSLDGRLAARRGQTPPTGSPPATNIEVTRTVARVPGTGGGSND